MSSGPTPSRREPISCSSRPTRPTGATYWRAVNYARHQPGVVAVSMSWGSVEFPFELPMTLTHDPGETHRRLGFAREASRLSPAVEMGRGTSYPAVSPNVLAVGGTTLTVGPWGNYVSEKA